MRTRLNARNAVGVNSSVIVLEPEDASPHRLIPRLAGTRYPARRPRLSLLVAIIAAHAGAVGLIVLAPAAETVPVAETERMLTVYVRPRVVVSRAPSVAPPAIRVPKDAPLLYDAAIPEIEEPTIAVLGVGTMPPHPDDAAIDPAPFARQAGLQPGDGATIVLRLQVLWTGDVGDVEVDVSSGAPAIDRAAIDYARAIPWIGGMIDGRPQTIWIRWGLQG